MRVKKRRVYSLSYMSIGDDNNASINKQEDDRSNTEDDTPKQTTISGEYNFVHKMCIHNISLSINILILLSIPLTQVAKVPF